MNYLNIFLIFLIGVYVLQGFHKGFLVSVGNTIGLGVSWAISFLFSPMLSEAIQKGSFYKFLLNFTEGSSRIFDQTQGHQLVSQLSSAQIHDIVSQSAGQLPVPFQTLIEENMNGLAFKSTAYASTVADYFDYTVANVVVNILAFLIIYILARVIISVVLNTVNYASPMPVLKHCDGIAGGGVGLARGVLDMFTITMIIPVLLISMPVNIPLFSDMIFDSSIASYFYTHNFLLGYISGMI